MIDDNFHYMDEDERSPTVPSRQQRKLSPPARGSWDENLQRAFKPGMSAADLYRT
jgi:hypothetical protein